MKLSPPPLQCRPPLWARGGHGQTLFGHLLPSPTPQFDAVEREARPIALPDGDQLVTWYAHGNSGVLLLLAHGLGGDAESDYIRRTAVMGLAAGHSILALNHRGCGAGRGLARGPYHSGRSDDMAAACALARELEPQSRLLAIGFSLSGNALLLQLGTGLEPLPDLAIAVNPPIDLALASKHISNTSNRIYDLRFVARCRQSLKERLAAGLIEHDYSIPRFASLRQVDDLYTAPAGGFADADDYYARCSAIKHIRKIKVPTVLLTSADDPFVVAGDFFRCKRSDATYLHVETVGGHMGYLTAEKTPLGNRRWLDFGLQHYVQQLLDLS